MPEAIPEQRGSARCAKEHFFTKQPFFSTITKGTGGDTLPAQRVPDQRYIENAEPEHEHYIYAKETDI